MSFEVWVTLNGGGPPPLPASAAETLRGRIDGVSRRDQHDRDTSAPIPSDVATASKQAFKRNAIVDDSMIGLERRPTVYSRDDPVMDGGTRSQEAAWTLPRGGRRQPTTSVP
jgi:hypothetical protein